MLNSPLGITLPRSQNPPAGHRAGGTVHPPRLALPGWGAHGGPRTSLGLLWGAG